MILKLYRTNPQMLIFYLGCVVDVRSATVRKTYIDQNCCEDLHSNLASHTSGRNGLEGRNSGLRTTLYRVSAQLCRIPNAKRTR